MKRWIALLAVLMLMSSCVLAEGMLPMEVYRSAKETVGLISYGEFDMALSKLGLNKSTTAKQLKNYIDKKCPEIYRGTVQTEVSVAWHDGEKWHVAVPFEAPDDRAVGAIVFTLTPNITFETLTFARWGSVTDEYSVSDKVEWNLPYNPGYIIVGDW